MPRFFLLVGLVLLAACSDTELVGIHITLQKDGSGVVTARALQATNVPGPAEARLRGVQWQMRASLVSSQGAFASLAQLELGEDEVRFVASNDDLPRLRVVLKRKKDLAWVATLVPDEATRKTLAKVHDPHSKQKEIADSIRLEVEFPEQVVSSGVAPSGRGIESQHERNRAYLILPVQSLLTDDEDLVWDVSWK